MLKRILSQARDPLYKNSFFIMLSSITNAGFGFFFWMIAHDYFIEMFKIMTSLYTVYAIQHKISTDSKTLKI